MTLTLRIKRVYFDEILSGKKTIEYRDAKAFYKRIFESGKQYSTLRLHYQRERVLEADLLSIALIPTPRWIRALPDVTFSENTYALRLKNARQVR